MWRAKDEKKRTIEKRGCYAFRRCERGIERKRVCYYAWKERDEYDEDRRADRWWHNKWEKGKIWKGEAKLRPSAPLGDVRVKTYVDKVTTDCPIT